MATKKRGGSQAGAFVGAAAVAGGVVLLVKSKGGGGATLQGKVVNSANEGAIADAVATVGDSELRTTDAKGQFVIEKLAVATNLALLIKANGYADYTETLVLKAGPNPKTFPLTPQFIVNWKRLHQLSNTIVPIGGAPGWVHLHQLSRVIKPTGTAPGWVHLHQVQDIVTPGGIPGWVHLHQVQDAIVPGGIPGWAHLHQIQGVITPGGIPGWVHLHQIQAIIHVADGVLDGYIRDTDNAALVGMAYAQAASDGTLYSAQSDSRTGAYTMSLPPDTYSIWATCPGFYDSTPVSITVSSGGIATHDFTLARIVTRIYGTVTSASTGGGMGGVRVYADSTDGTKHHETYSGAGGAYSLPIEAGVTYNAYADARPNYLLSPPYGPFSLAFGAERNVNFSLTAAPQTGIMGTVKNQAGTGILGASVVAIIGGSSYSDLTDASGVYQIDCPAGNYNVSVSHASYDAPPAQPVTVPSAGYATANFTMLPKTLPLYIVGNVTAPNTSTPVGENEAYIHTADNAYGDYTSMYGDYAIQVPPGTYVLYCTDQTGLYQSQGPVTVVVVNADVVQDFNMPAL